MSKISYDERVQTYTNALITYGEARQIVVAIEELSECQKELCKVLRHKEDMEHLAEEIADVLITMEQMVLFFGIKDRVDEWMDSKVQRLDKKLRKKAGL